MNDYEQYEAKCKKIRKANERLLADFGAWLKASGISDKTIKNHVSNIDFYINEYLLYEEAVEARDGASAVGMFLGYWFIKKAMWSSQASIKSNAASLKKFYAFMFEQGLTDKASLDDLNQTIKEEMPEWLETMERYADPDIEDMEDVWRL